MPTHIEVSADNRRLRFNDNFRLQELDPDGAVIQETDWESVSSERENEISYRFNGETRTSLAVRYRFNARNQLTLQIIQQSGVPTASDPWTLPGKIFVKDVEGVGYALIDGNGDVSGHRIEIYGRLDFPEGYGRLRVSFPDSTETFILGSNKNRSLSAREYVSGGDLTRDLLAFNAVTRNTVDGEDEEAPAEIRFYGRWDMHENELVFVTKYDNTSAASPLGYLAIGGNIKGTNFGLVIEKDGALAFQIKGRYEWNHNTLGWDLKVGHSKSSGLEARLGIDGDIAVGKNGRLKFSGGATLKKGSQGRELAFDLKLEYAAVNRSLVFTVTGDQGGYEVQLSGDFKITNGNVKFEITVADKNGQKSVKARVDFGFYTKNMDLKLSLEAVLTRNGLTLKLDLEFRFFWGPTGPVAELP